MDETQNPYASPSADDHDLPAVAARPAAATYYRSGHPLARFAIVMLLLSGLADLVSAGSSFMQVGLVQRAVAGEMVSEEELLANDARERIVGLCQFGLLIVTATAFLMWFYRAHKNLGALGATGLKFSPGWAVGCWFVPIVYLFVPCQAALEIWRNSNPRGLAFPERGSQGQGLVGWWWGFWIVNNLAGMVVAQFSVAAKTAEDYLSASWANLGADLFGLPLAALAIAVVYQIDRNQEQRHSRLESGAALELDDGVQFLS